MTPEADTLTSLASKFGGVPIGNVLSAAEVAGQSCDISLSMDGGFRVLRVGDGLHGPRDLVRFARMSIGLPATPPVADNDNQPVDLWAEAERPSLPAGLLPDVIERFSRERALQMGVDPGGLATAALAVCAAAIPDSIRLQVKANDTDWTESARLWVALIGNPSTKKSPTIAAAVKPLREIDHGLARDFMEKSAAVAALDAKSRAAAPRPKQIRCVLEDVTVEAAQEVLKDSPQGVLVLRDELSGWFGAMEKYGSAKGAASDRSFWLQAFNGGPLSVNRIGRGPVYVPNLSACLLGGIQPEPIRAIAADAADDGLLQRIVPIVLGPAAIDSDEAPSTAAHDYAAEVRRLHQLRKPRHQVGPVPIETVLRFSPAAQALRTDLAAKHHHLVSTWESVNRKLAAHFGKYDGIFARLCVVFHCLDGAGDAPDVEISVVTAERSADFLHHFLFRHALAFYGNVLGLVDGHDILVEVADYILAHDLSEVTARDVLRGSRSMRALDKAGAEAVLQRLDAMGWLDPVESRGNQHASRWRVRPAVHDLFELRAESEAVRRSAIRQVIVESATRLE